MSDKVRCAWCDLKNPLYVRYHDEEWGVPVHDDHKLYEMLILEMFQAGLSWETILNKRENFRKAYADFELDTVCSFDEEKMAELAQDAGIIRNRLKIRASVENSRIFRDIVKECGSFDDYLMSFTQGKVFYEDDAHPVSSPLSDAISTDLKKRGMKFCGTVIIYAYLQAIGIVNAHMKGCYKYLKPHGNMIR